jgi:hypothetical protein
MIWEKSRKKVFRLEIWLEWFSAGESQSMDQIFSLSQGDDMWRFKQVLQCSKCSDHRFISNAQRECVETHILKFGCSRSEARSISESKKIKFEYSFEWIG